MLRLTNTYGPRLQIRNNRQGFVGIFIRRALKNETIKVFGSGLQVRDFNYVDDVVDALLLAALTEECYGRVFNLGAPVHYSLLELVAVLHRLARTNHEIVPFPSDKKLIDIGDYYGDYSRFAEATGWQPNVDLEEGLARTLEYFRTHSMEYWA